MTADELRQQAADIREVISLCDAEGDPECYADHVAALADVEKELAQFAVPNPNPPPPA